MKHSKVVMVRLETNDQNSLVFQNQNFAFRTPPPRMDKCAKKNFKNNSRGHWKKFLSHVQGTKNSVIKNVCTSEWLLNKIFNCLNQCMIQPYSTSHQKRFCILAPIFLVKAVWMHGFGGLCTLYPISTQYCWMCFKLVLYTGIIFKIQIFKTIILAHCHMYVVIKAA